MNTEIRVKVIYVQLYTASISFGKDMNFIALFVSFALHKKHIRQQPLSNEGSFI